VKNFLAIFALCCVSIHAENLADVLARMDQAAQSFRSLSAKMHRVQFTAVLNESSTMDGTLRLKRVNKRTTGIVEFLQPDPRTVYVSGKTIEVYLPKAKTEEVYDASKYVANIDQFLLLGFGTTSKELMKFYALKFGGTEQVAGKMCSRIELTPTTPQMKTLVTKIELWIPEGEANPVREKVTEPSKNYELMDYSDIQLNPALPDASFELHVPDGTKKVYPQK
jgi:outer membrane lipoprotein-sorting protein